MCWKGVGRALNISLQQDQDAKTPKKTQEGRTGQSSSSSRYSGTGSPSTKNLLFTICRSAPRLEIRKGLEPPLPKVTFVVLRRRQRLASDSEGAEEQVCLECWRRLPASRQCGQKSENKRWRAIIHRGLFKKKKNTTQSDRKRSSLALVWNGNCSIPPPPDVDSLQSVLGRREKKPRHCDRFPRASKPRLFTLIRLLHDLQTAKEEQGSALARRPLTFPSQTRLRLTL